MYSKILGIKIRQVMYTSLILNDAKMGYELFSDVGESRVWWRADFQSGSIVLNKTIGDEGITVDFRFIKVHTSN